MDDHVLTHIIRRATGTTGCYCALETLYFLCGRRIPCRKTPCLPDGAPVSTSCLQRMNTSSLPSSGKIKPEALAFEPFLHCSSGCHGNTNGANCGHLNNVLVTLWTGQVHDLRRSALGHAFSRDELDHLNNVLVTLWNWARQRSAPPCDSRRASVA